MFPFTLLILFFLLCIGALFYFLRSFTRLWKGEAPFVPLSRSASRKLSGAIRLPTGSTFYDLGSGDGRIVTAMAKVYKDSVCIGVERDSVAHFLSRMRLLYDPLPNAKFIKGDFHTTPFEDATHVYVYLFPSAIDVIFPIFSAKLRKGTVIFSCNFKYSARQPDEIIHFGKGAFSHILYKYSL